MRLLLAALVMVSSVVGVGLLEASLGLLLAFPPQAGVAHDAVVAYYMFYRRDIIQFLPSCSRYDAELTYTLRPGHCRFANQEFETGVQINSLGFRGSEANLRAPVVIVLGDSFAMGWGVDNDSTFAALLERRTGLTTLNTGTSSYGTARELLALKRVDRSAARHIVIQYCENDFTENEQFVRGGGHLVIRDRATYDSLVRDHRRSTRYYPGKLTRRLLPVLRDMWGARAKPRDLSGKIPAERQVDAFLSALQLSPVPLDGYNIIVLAICTDEALQFTDALRRRLADTRAQGWVRHIQVLDVGRSLSKQDYYRIDGHARAAGHLKVAEMIASAIREDERQRTR